MHQGATLLDHESNLLYSALRNARSSIANADIVDYLNLFDNFRRPLAAANLLEQQDEAAEQNEYLHDAYAAYQLDSVLCINESVDNSPSDIDLDGCKEEAGRPRHVVNNKCDYSINSISTISAEPQSRPHMLISLPDHSQQPRFNFLLDSGSDLNVLSDVSSAKLNVQLDRLSEIPIKNAGGMARALGPVLIIFETPTRGRIALPFVIMKNTPNIIGWKAIKEFRLLDKLYAIAPLNQPPPPHFPAAINELLQQCKPTIPMRVANFRSESLGTFVKPASPIQQQPRRISSAKFSFLHNFVEKMMAAEVISIGRQSDYLCPLHLVAKVEKNHNQLPGQFRCTVDMVQINSLFNPRLPTLVNRL